MAAREAVFKFPKIKHEYPLSEQEVEAFLIKPLPLPADWCEENIELKGGYSNNGPLEFAPWQRDPINAVLDFSKVIYVGPVQTGKSLLADMVMFFGMVKLGLEGMVIYNNSRYAEKMFSRRIRPMIQRNEVFGSIWSGKEDDLKINDLSFRNCFWGIASTENRNDIASFPAGMVIWSEASKARKMGFDVIGEIRGRQESYPPNRRKIVIESSPNEAGDPMYNEVFQPGSVILEPHVPCPICGEYQVLVDEQIKLRPTGEEEPDHNPARIRLEGESAVWYECYFCKQEIREIDRPKMFQKVIWAAREINEKVTEKYTFHQDAEVVHKDGSVECDRSKMLVPVFNWNRLVNPDFKFFECLARFFESKRTPEKFHIYLNNDMAKFYRPKSERMASGFLESKAIMSDYYMHGDGAHVPDGVLLVVCSVDTQDSGYWFVTQGFGEGLESWVLRYGFVDYAIDNDENMDYDQGLRALYNGIYGQPYIMRVNGNDLNLTINMGFIDRGGHRSGLVDYLCERLINFNAYIGSPRNDPSKDLVWETNKGYYYGKTEQLSELVHNHMKMKTWHLPHDTESEFFKQAVKQYHIEEVDKYGNKKRRWIHGGDDHLRDCLNMNYGCLVAMGLDRLLFDSNACAQLKGRLVAAANKPHATTQINKVEKQETNPEQKNFLSNTIRGGSYFGRGRWK